MCGLFNFFKRDRVAHVINDKGYIGLATSHVRCAFMLLPLVGSSTTVPKRAT